LRFIVVLLLCALNLIFAYEVKTVYIGSGYMRTSYNEGMICVTNSLARSVVIISKEGNVVGEISVGLAYPVSAVYHAGRVFVTDYYKSSVLVYSVFGKLISSIRVGERPATLMLHSGKIYVSSLGNSTVYKIDPYAMSIEKSFRFSAPSLYFFLDGEEIIFLYYGSTVQKTVEFANSERTFLYFNEIKTPLKVHRVSTRYFLLDYKTGTLLCTSKTKEIWRVNLPDFAPDMVLANNFIFVNSLKEPVISVVSLEGEITDVIELPNITTSLEVLNDKIIALNHVPGELYIVDPYQKKVETLKLGSYSVSLVKISENSVFVLSTDSGEGYFLDF